MASFSSRTIAALVVAAVLLPIIGCGDSWMRAGGYTHFHFTTAGGSGSVVTLVSITTEQIAIVSDCSTQYRESNEPKVVSGSHVAFGGRKIPWSCETKDARTISKISIDGTEYNFADGNTFLIACKAKPTRVRQLQLAELKHVLDLDELRKKNAEVDDFFAQSDRDAAADNPDDTNRPLATELDDPTQ